MLAQVFHADDLQRCLIRAFENDRRCDAGLQRLLPAQCAQAPLIARFHPGEVQLGPRRAEIVAALLAERQKRCAHHHADHVAADILRAGLAAAVAEETGQRLERAGNQRFAEDISGSFWIGHLRFR